MIKAFKFLWTVMDRSDKTPWTVSDRSGGHASTAANGPWTVLNRSEPFRVLHVSYVGPEPSMTVQAFHLEYAQNRPWPFRTHVVSQHYLINLVLLLVDCHTILVYYHLHHAHLCIFAWTNHDRPKPMPLVKNCQPPVLVTRFCTYVDECV